MNRLRDQEFFKRNDLKKAIKLCTRIHRNYRKKGEKSQFVDEDIETLTNRDLSD